MDQKIKEVVINEKQIYIETIGGKVSDTVSKNYINRDAVSAIVIRKIASEDEFSVEICLEGTHWLKFGATQDKVDLFR